VADGRWSRVGSTNLNIASWFGNCEIDALVEDEGFGSQMTEMYLEDLKNSTEVVLNTRKRLSRPKKVNRQRHRAGGSGGRAAAGALRIGNAVGAAFTNRRVLGPVEARLMFTFGTLLLILAIVFTLFPRALAYPVVAIFVWIGISLLYRGFKLRRERKRTSAEF
jgi:cardiolipin synthase A/B